MNRIEILRLFKENLVKFTAELCRQYDEPDFELLHLFFSAEIPIEDAMIIFSGRILPCAKLIEAEDERFFIENTDIFEGIQRDKVHYFKDMWTSPTMGPEDKKVIWKWFKLFLKLAQKYNQIVSATSPVAKKK